MSYSIHYGVDTRQEKGWKRSRKHFPAYLFAAGVMILALGVFPQIREMLRVLLIPWLDDATVSAFSAMIGSIEEGVSVPTALVDFCRTVITNAGIPV